MRGESSPTIRGGKHDGKPQCQESVAENTSFPRYHQCHNPAFEDKKCKFHLAVERRAQERSEAREKLQKNLAHNSMKAAAQAARLSKVLGITVRPYSFASGFNLVYTGEMIVPADFLEAAAEEVE